MQTADIAVNTMLVWADLSGRFSPLRSAPAQMIFFQQPLTAPIPLMPFSARSAPFSAPLTLRSHALHWTGLTIEGPPLVSCETTVISVFYAVAREIRNEIMWCFEGKNAQISCHH